MASHQDMDENGMSDDLSESSQKNGTKKKHVQLQFMENNNSEDWHGTRLSLLSHIHADYRNIERTLNERPSSLSITAQTGGNGVDLEHEPATRNHDEVRSDCMDRLNGEVSDDGTFQSRHLNGTRLLLADTNRRERSLPELTNGTHASADMNTSGHAECDQQPNCECKNHRDNDTSCVVDPSESAIPNRISLPDVLPHSTHANKFDTPHTSHEPSDSFRIYSNVLPQPGISTSEQLINHVDDSIEDSQNEHYCSDDVSFNHVCLTENRTSQMFQNNLDPSDVVSEENHRCCGIHCDVRESVLNVISGEESVEQQNHENTESCLEVELNNLLLENFSEHGNNVGCDREEKAEDVDSDLDAGNQDDNSSASSSSDIVDDMIMNVEMGSRLQLSSVAGPTCLPRDNSSEDSDEGLEVDVCDDASEREEESNNEDVKNLPMDDGDDDGCLDVWDMPLAIASEFEEEEQQRRIDSSDTFFDCLPENYTMNDRDNLFRNANNHDAGLKERVKHNSDTKCGSFTAGDSAGSPGHHHKYRPCKQSLATGHGTNSFDELSVHQEFPRSSFNGSSMNSFQGMTPQSLRESISDDEKLSFEPSKTYKTDDEDSLGESSNVSETEYGFNHQCENSNNKNEDYNDSKNGMNEIFSSAISANNPRTVSNTEDHLHVSSTFGASSRDEPILSESFRNCRLFEEAVMSVNHESRSVPLNQRQYFSLATGGSLQNPSSFPHCAQSEEQEDESHSEKRLLLQEVKDQMAMQLRRLDERRREELRFEEVLQFEEEEQDELDLDDEDDDLRPSNFIGAELIQEGTIGSEEESSDIVESIACMSVDDVAFAEIEGACGCSHEVPLDHVSCETANGRGPCRNRNCRVWPNLMTRDDEGIGDEFFDTSNEERQRDLHSTSREGVQQPFIVWRPSLLRENEPNEYDPMSELEGLDRNNEFVVRRKHQASPANDSAERTVDGEEFNHNQNNNEEDIDSPESLVELEENILRGRLLALKRDDVDTTVWHGLHPSNVLGTSDETLDLLLSDSSGNIASNATTSFSDTVAEVHSESVEDCVNICNDTRCCLGKDDNTQNHNIIVQVPKQRPKPVEELPPNSAFIWTPRKAVAYYYYCVFKRPYPSVYNAVKNALFAFGYKPNLNEEQNFIQRIKESCSTVPKLLISCRKHFGLPEDISAALVKHSNDEVFSRFFPFFPRRNVNLYKWLKEWISLGVIPIASYNPQVGIAPDSAVPKEWRHQMIYGVDEEQAYLCTPNVRMSYPQLMTQLSSDSILLVAREDVLNRWDRWSRLGELKHPPDNDSRWIQMNVLGQVVNMMREQSAPKPHEDYSRRYYYKPLKQRRTAHVRMPADYKGGITLCVKKEDKEARDAVQNAPELPLLD